MNKYTRKISLVGGAIVFATTLAGVVGGFAVLFPLVQDQVKNDLQRSLKSRDTELERTIEQGWKDTYNFANQPLRAEAINILNGDPNNKIAYAQIKAVAGQFSRFGFSAVVFRNLAKKELVRNGTFIQNPNLDVIVHTTSPSHLLWKNGFLLRAHINILIQGKVIGSMDAERPLLQLTNLYRQIFLGRTTDFAICAPARPTTMHCFPFRSTGGKVLMNLPDRIDGKLIPMSYAIANKTGLIETKDYRGRAVIAAYAPIGTLGLGSVLKIDADELYHPISSRYKTLLGLLIVLVATGILLLYKQVLPLVRRLLEEINERKKAEDELRISATAFQTQEGILITDAQANILRVNHAFTDITGYAADEVLGINPRLLKSDRQDADFYEAMWNSIQQTGHWSGEIWNRRKNGSIYPEQLTITAVKDYDGNVVNYVGSMVDITSRKNSEEKIAYLAYYDHLTGLPNRRLYLDRLEQEIKKSNRTRDSLAILFIDLDKFKEINDTLGHAKGDRLLIDVSKRIKECVRETDTVSRLGGDEFTVILPEYETALNIDRIVENILQELNTPFNLSNGEFVYISGSIGITLYPDDAQDVDELLKNADQAMYAAKAAGRNRFSYFTPSMQQVARDKMAMTNELRGALSRHELEVYYQPIVDLTTGEIEKAEALLRWNQPVQGQIGPAEFIPLAEEFGLIQEIGNWVFSQVTASILGWRRDYGKWIQVSVNRSPAEFNDEKMDWVEVLDTAGLTGTAINMEITEGMLVGESDRIYKSLMMCRAAGIEVSVDDFGTGYSALSYLKRFDIDYLKIDQTFVRNFNESESDKALVEVIIVMAHKLGLKTIAEGVETKEQRDILMSFGCDYAQGYLYSRAVPATEFEKFLS